MSLEYPCVYHVNGKCTKHTEPDYVDFCVFGPCHEQTPSRGDRFRCMTDEQLAEYLATNTDKFCKNLPKCAALLEANTPIPEEMCKACALEWLKEPAEESLPQSAEPTAPSSEGALEGVSTK